jgi:hypothetical protein
MNEELKWRQEQFAELRNLMREMRRNPGFYFFQREALWLGYTAEAEEDIHNFEQAQAVMHERVHRGLVARTMQRCISQYVEASETADRCQSYVAYAATPWGRLAREVHEEVGQMDEAGSEGDADTYVPSQSSSSYTTVLDDMDSCRSVSTSGF